MKTPNRLNFNELKDFYTTYKEKIASYDYIFSVTSYYNESNAPKDGVPYGIDMISLSEEDYFDYVTNPEYIANIEALYQLTTDELNKKELALRLRSLHEISKLPKDVYLDFEKSASESALVWEEALEKNDYNLFKPHLISMIEKQKNILTYYGDNVGYDFLLDEFETGMTREKYEPFFAEIKEKLVPVIHAIKERGRTIDNSILKQSFSIKGQKDFTEELKEALHMNPRQTLLLESVHPYCSEFSTKDSRFTTHYREFDVMSSILSVAHEYGHALYGLQIDETFEKTMFISELGSAMHESQSRLIENHIAMRPSFWKGLYPKLQAQFLNQLGTLAFDDFMDKINISTPSFIRTAADELTYPLHVLIRYEIEKQIFDGTINYDTLDILWADKYEEYLGIRPATHSEGILQDVHWSEALFGYFPTYALGSAFAAQFFAQMQKDIDVDGFLEAGRFDKIALWLKENVHQYGSSKSYDEILLKATGETFNPRYYTEYLVEKYTTLYKL